MNKTSWIIIGITGGICLVIGIFILGPGLIRDLSTYKATQAAKKELADLAQKQKVLTELGKNTELDKINATAAGYIPEEAKSSELVLELTAIVAASGMSVEQISLEAATAPAKPADEVVTTTKTPAPVTAADQKKADAVQPVSFSLKISGTFQNLMSFFKLTETSSRLISVKSVSFAQDKDKFTANIKAEAYWKKITPTTNNSLANITVSAETLQKFANLKTFSTPIDTSTEAGFGRTNPFDAVN